MSMPRRPVLRQHDRVTRIGVYPGSFNPLTIAHVEIARVAKEKHHLDQVHLVVSEVALDKEAPPGPSFDERIVALRKHAAATTWLEIRITDMQLVADIAEGYDLVIMGADKWLQLHDERYYSSAQERDDALARLPPKAIAPREGFDVSPDLLLDIDPSFWAVSSTLARSTHAHYLADG